MLSFTSPSYEDVISKEFIVTNGIGGYASSSITGCNTRRYHGMLVASLNPPTDRLVVVSKIEESIALATGQTFELSSNQYPGAIHPQGFQYLSKFERKPLPKTTFSVNGNVLEKTVFMVHGSNTTVVEYTNAGNSAFTVNLTPLFVSRDYHHLFRENALYDFYYKQSGNSKLVIYPYYGAAPVYFSFSKGEFRENRSWYRNFQYEIDRQRGQDFVEDAYSLGSVQMNLQPGEKAYLTFTMEAALMKDDPEALKQIEIRRSQNLVDKNISSEFLRDLIVSGDQFLIHRKSTDSKSILAGYHWFTDWGRDTMIALRGLCISTGRNEDTKSILNTFFKYLDKGMLPNRFPDRADDAVDYNTIDATLWLFVVLYEYYQKTQDINFIREHFNQLNDIIKAHLEGTRYGIKVTPEGLLAGGSGTDQLTWMDARIDNYVVTPRHGCPVEINALWYNALKTYQFFADLLGKNQNYSELIEQMRLSFRKYFINNEGYLNDVMVPEGNEDRSVRPNQIYAVSLPFSMLTPSEEYRVVAKVTKELFTPVGLRSLSPAHPDFRPLYAGNQWQRDTAYHQGTVWAFLLGEYYIAYLKVNGNTLVARKEVVSSLKTMMQHFYEKDCIHGISEIFDGANPQEGKGTAHQAWSIGMLVKVIMEYELDELLSMKKITTSSRELVQNN